MIRGLSEKGRELYGYLVSFAEKGYSANKALEALRELGLGYRRQDFLNDYRIIRGAAEQWEKMKYVPRHAVISDRLYTPGHTNYPEKYMTTVRVVIDFGDGVWREKYVTIRHDTLLSRREIEERALEKFIQEAESYQQAPEYWRVRDIMPVRGIKRWEW